ncbi:MAG: hypothetical protein IMW89_06885 [Ktedonobacteraceae bacterium]|nr:hypothetical protein [Ktedonobacteraceae bacterium]
MVNRMGQKWVYGLVMSLAVLGLAVMGMQVNSSPARAAEDKVRVWVQVLDSCQQALGGEKITLTGNGLNITKSIPQKKVRTVDRVYGNCPLLHGNCARVQDTGCTFFDIPIPASGVARYTLTLTKAAPHYAYCIKPTCPGGPEKATVKVDEYGNVSATVSDKTVRKEYPANSGTRTDPVLFHSWDNR